MVDLKAAQHVRDLIGDAVSHGGVITSGSEPDGVLMSATVVDYVTPDMRLYREESFGPVAAIIRVEDEEAAIAAANDSEYGLSAAVFSRDIARALSVARRIQSGICHINGPTVHDEAQMPFGGVKASGYGRFGGQAGVAEFTELRWITIETQPGQFPI
jgi:acyl-CoA reductase-like NAD-dependent aldehyde dehydrogenase